MGELADLFPYEFEGRRVNGGELEGEATLTHVLPALPEIIAPVSDGEDPPFVVGRMPLVGAMG